MKEPKVMNIILLILKLGIFIDFNGRNNSRKIREAD